MNYYKRHLGDYAKDTGHLSVLEHGAYTLLLDAYYATERPIPADKAHRIAKANTKAEIAAVDAVLADFFTSEGLVYRQARCDREIVIAKESEGEGEQRRENERLRQARHRERRKDLFAALRARGEVPDYDTPTTELETLLSRVTERDGHAVVTVDATAIHKPLASTPEKDKQGASPDGEAPLPDGPHGTAPIPYHRIVDLFNATLEKLPKVRDINGARRTAMRVAWQESAQRRSLEFWQAYFEECAEDPFLSGTGPYTNGHENWRPDFDYLLRAKVVTRVYEKAMHRLERGNEARA